MSDFLFLYGPVVAIMVILAVIIHMRLMETPAYRGWWGEYKVNLILKLCLSNQYTVFSNAIYRGQFKGESTQVDHIVVSRFGIWVLETKTFGGRIVIDPVSPERWIQIVGRRRYSLDHPLKQNWAHVKSVQRITGVHSQKIHSYAVMAGTATFEYPLPERVFTAWQALRKIQSYRTPVLTRAAAHSVCVRLRRHRIKGGYWAARHHVARLKRKQKPVRQEQKKAP